MCSEKMVRQRSIQTHELFIRVCRNVYCSFPRIIKRMTLLRRDFYIKNTLLRRDYSL